MKKEIERNKEIERLEEIEVLLLVVDMVEGFTRIGNMSNPYMTKIIGEVVRLVNYFLDNGYAVAATKEAHSPDSVEFNDYPNHCEEGTEEARLVAELIPFEPKMMIYEKNSTCVAVAPEFIEDLKHMKKLKKVIVVGGCTDICLMQAAIPVKCLFNQLNQNVEVIVPENAVDTYDAPNHGRDEWNEMAFRFMKQAGIQIVKKYEGRK